jgi:peptidoglycan/xylan/chitin deacetylase (PgdA/CDA1 family)
MKAFARDAIAGLLAKTGMTSPERFGRDRLNIATFHRVLPEEQRDAYPYPMLAVTPGELAAFLDFFNEHFFCTTLAGAHRLFDLGVRPDRPLLAITFDDAQLDNFVHARPALEARRLHASFYVPVDAIDRKELLWHDRLGFAALASGGNEAIVEEAKTWSPEERLRRVEELERRANSAAPDWAGPMTWDQIRKLAAAGHEIGSHSLSHALLPQLDEAAIAREVAGSKSRIEEQIDRALSSFCYPNGDYDDRSVRAVEHAGYACAVTTEWGSNARGADRFRLRRCDMNPHYSTTRHGSFSRERVAWRMSGLHPGLRP